MASNGATGWRWTSLGALIVSFVLLTLALIVFLYAIAEAYSGYADPDFWIPLSYFIAGSSILADFVALGAGLVAWQIERKSLPAWLYLVMAWLACKLAIGLLISPRFVG